MKPSVIHTQFDHTSLLKYLIDKWTLGPLGERAAHANTFTGDLLTTVDAPDRVPTLSLPTLQSLPAPKYGQIATRTQPTLSSHQSALIAMTQLLESMTEVAGESLQGRIKRAITGFDGVVDVAMERVDQFLRQQRTTAAAQTA